MNRKFFNYGIWGIGAVLIGAVLFVASLCPVTAFAATNISADTTSHWAWNGFIGWINFYSTGNVWVSSTSTVGYASSSAGIISLDCGTVGMCNGSNNYQVTNDGAGNLSGWAWNDEYGWISFDCHNGGTGCGASPYRVIIDSNGNFSGYAWNDTIGWISFNCNQPNPPSNTCTPSNYEVKTLWTLASISGYLDSKTFDTGVQGGAQLNSVLWHGLLPPGTTLGFQFAVSTTSSGPWNFIGPNGVPNSTSSYWAANTPSSSVPLDYNLYNNFRYFRYRVTLYSNTAQTLSPRVDDVVVNWSP